MGGRVLAQAQKGGKKGPMTDEAVRGQPEVAKKTEPVRGKSSCDMGVNGRMPAVVPLQGDGSVLPIVILGGEKRTGIKHLDQRKKRPSKISARQKYRMVG